MFLSHVRLPAVSDYEVHQHLHKLFDAEKRCFIFRRQTPEDVLMLSIIRPRHPHRTIELKRIHTGRPLSFAADLRPVKASSRFKGGKEDIVGHFQRRDWLKRKLNGAAKLHFIRFEDGWITTKNGVHLLVAQATGVLEIQDRTTFATLLQSGIGRGRAFGCGMIYLPEIMHL